MRESPPSGGRRRLRRRPPDERWHRALDIGLLTFRRLVSHEADPRHASLISNLWHRMLFVPDLRDAAVTCLANELQLSDLSSAVRERLTALVIEASTPLDGCVMWDPPSSVAIPTPLPSSSVVLSRPLSTLRVSLTPSASNQTLPHPRSSYGAGQPSCDVVSVVVDGAASTARGPSQALLYALREVRRAIIEATLAKSSWHGGRLVTVQVPCGLLNRWTEVEVRECARAAAATAACRGGLQCGAVEGAVPTVWGMVLRRLVDEKLERWCAAYHPPLQTVHVVVDGVDQLPFEGTPEQLECAWDAVCGGRDDRFRGLHITLVVKGGAYLDAVGEGVEDVVGGGMCEGDGGGGRKGDGVDDDGGAVERD